MYYIDNTAAAAGLRHSRRPVVTASIDRLDYQKPVFVGEMVTFKSSVNMVSRTSMEVGVRVEAENLLTGEIRHVASAYLTLVALDEKGKPTQIRPLILETETEKRRHQQANKRRETRLAERKQEKAYNSD